MPSRRGGCFRARVTDRDLVFGDALTCGRAFALREILALLLRAAFVGFAAAFAFARLAEAFGFAFTAFDVALAFVLVFDLEIFFAVRMQREFTTIHAPAPCLPNEKTQFQRSVKQRCDA